MYLKYFVILLTFVIIKISKQNAVNLTPLKKGTKKLETIETLSKEFGSDNTLLIFFNQNKYTDYISQQIRIKTLLYPGTFSTLFKKLGKFDVYIISVNTIENIRYVIKELHNLYICNYAAKYLIITNSENIADIFKLTWKYKIVNINIMIETEFEFELYTHFPYANKSCGINYTPIKIEQHLAIFYPDKIATNMNGCVLKLMTMGITPYVINNDAPKDDPTRAGFELTMIDTVLQRMNFTRNFIINPDGDWGFVFPNGSFSCMFKSLDENKADILMGMIIGNSTQEKYFDTTISHIDTAANWFVPSAQQIAQWKNLTVIFEPIVWFSIFVVFVLNGTFWWILGRNKEAGESYNQLSLCLMGSFYILLQGSFANPKTWKIRLVVIIWAFSSVLIFTAHQCQLTGILTSPLYEHQITNVKEMVQSKLGYVMHSNLMNIFDPNNSLYSKILSETHSCPLTPECVNRTAFDRDVAVLKNKRQVSYLMKKYYTYPNGKPMLYMFKDPEYSVWCKYWVKRGFPFLKKIDHYILLLHSNGLFKKWDSDISFGSKEDGDFPELESLNLNHLQSAFYLLFLGYFVSLCMYIGEKYIIIFLRNIKMKITML